MSLNALYAIIDRVYVGHGCGQDAMAGITLAFPIMMLFGAFGVFVGAGHAALLSIKLGEGDRTACEKILGELVAFKLAFFCVLPPLVFLFLDPILRATGGDGVTPGALEQAKVYLRIVLFSHVFSHLAYGLSATMRSEGAVVPSMMCMVVGFGVNLVLDPIFIFGCGMGVAGAAWATVIAMLVSCLWAFAYYRPGHSAVRLRLRRIGFYRAYAGRAAGIGLSPALQQLMGSLINVSMQIAFAKWAVDRASATTQIASLGVFQMVMMLFFMPILGVQQGLAPIIGYCWGARSYARVRRVLLLGLAVTTACCTFAALAQVLVPEPIVRIFTDGADRAFLALAAGVLDFDATLTVLEARGRFMQEACEATPSGMIAIVGASPAQLDELCAKTGCTPANINSAAQVVLSGDKAQIAAAAATAKELGIKRAIPLATAGAFHSKFMQPAREKLAPVLDGITFHAPKIPVISNVTGRVHSSNPAEIKDVMLRQVTETTRWADDIAAAKELGCTRFIEFGPGKVLSGLIKKIDAALTTLNVSDLATLDATVSAL